MSDTFVSVVLPTYNGAKYLQDAIQSVLDQTHIHWELIIVDSYSTDATPEIVARYIAQDSRVRAIQHPKEPGRLPGALNAGFEQAAGTYYTWLSDDNIMRPQALTMMAEFLDDHPEIGLLYTDYSDVTGDRAFIRLNRPGPPSRLLEKNIITPSFMYRCDVAKAVGGYRIDYFMAEDYDFWLRAFKVCKFHPLPTDCQEYRIHDGALTSQHYIKVLGAGERALQDFLVTTPRLSRYDRARIYVTLARLARQQGLPDRSRRYWWKAALRSPYLVLRRAVLAAVRAVFGKDASRKASEFYVSLKRRAGISTQN